jgi:alpha/beta superfamily hydrolase
VLLSEIAMPRTKELPPPPEKPEVSPPATVAGEEAVTVQGLPGEPSLEARIRVPPSEGAARAVVLCHPHPLYGGTMHSAVVLAIAKVLAEKGGERVASLRFNYRGVGASEGRYDEGVGETEDTRAAIAELRRRAPRAKLTVCGYSFGSWVGLRAAGIDGGVDRVCLVAPAARIFDFVSGEGSPALPEDALAFQGRIAIFLGDHDEFCDVAEAEMIAKTLGATLRVFEGADHYFMKSRRRLAERVIPAIAPEIAS